MKKIIKGEKVICVLLALSMLLGTATEGVTDTAYAKKRAGNEGTATLRVFSTSDLHGKSTKFNYDSAASTNGSLAQVATVIKQKKKELKNGTSLLLDMGDTIYGLGSNSIYTGSISGKEYMYDIIRRLGYDAMTVGNHDFNFGYTYMMSAIEKAKLYNKCIVANLVDAKTGKPVFKTNKIIKKTVKTSKGKKKVVRIGITGVITTDLGSTSSWKGYVKTKDLVESVEDEVEKLKKKKADVIVVMSHSGIGEYDLTEDMAPNVSYQLCLIKGVDIVCAGHTHENYPDPGSATTELVYSYPKVSRKTSFVNGTILIQEADRGKAVGVSDLTLTFKNGKVKVKPKSAELVKITPDIEEDAQVLSWNNTFEKKYHELYQKSLARMDDSVDNYFGMIEDNALIQIANEAKIAYGKKWITDNAPEYADLPIISDTTYSLTGDAGPDYYITANDEVSMETLLNVQLWERQFARVYRVTGAELRECLEWRAASLFVDTSNPELDSLSDETMRSLTAEGGLLPVVGSNWNTWKGYTVFDGVEYTIDLSQPPRYNKSGTTLLNNSHRIKSLTINGQNISDNQELIWVCYMKENRWPPINASIMSKRLDSSTINAAQIIHDYVEAQGEASEIKTRPEQNWKIIFPKSNYIIKSSEKSEELVYAKPWYVGTLTKENGYAYYQATLGSQSNSDESGPMLVVTSLNTRISGDPVPVSVTATDVSGISQIKVLYGVYAEDDSEWEGAETVEGELFEADENGIYTVLASDRRGNRSVRYIRIANYNPSVSTAPKVNKIVNTDTTVSGKASAGASVQVKTTYGTYGTTADDDGSFICEVKNLKADSTVKVSQTDTGGRSSGVTSMKVQRKASNAAIISSVTNKKSKLTGTLDDSKYCNVVAIKGDTVYVAKGKKTEYKNSNLYKKNKDKDIEEVKYTFNTKSKKFTLAVPNINAGQKISVYSYDWLGRVSYEQTFETRDVAPNAPHIRKVVAEEKMVYGYIPSPKQAEYRIAVKSGKKTYYGVTDESGYFSVKVSNLKAKRTIKVTASDVLNGKTRKSRAVSAKPVSFRELSDIYYSNTRFEAMYDDEKTLKGSLKKDYGTKLYLLTAKARIKLSVSGKKKFKHKFSTEKEAGTVMAVISRNKDGTINTFRRIKVKKKEERPKK